MCRTALSHTPAFLSDPYDTIEFDEGLDRVIDGRVEAMGADGRLMPAPSGEVYQVNLAEKILVTLLSKIANSSRIRVSG